MNPIAEHSEPNNTNATPTQIIPVVNVSELFTPLSPMARITPITRTKQLHSNINYNFGSIFDDDSTNSLPTIPSLSHSSSRATRNSSRTRSLTNTSYTNESNGSPNIDNARMFIKKFVNVDWMEQISFNTWYGVITILSTTTEIKSLIRDHDEKSALEMKVRLSKQEISKVINLLENEQKTHKIFSNIIGNQMGMTLTQFVLSLVELQRSPKHLIAMMENSVNLNEFEHIHLDEMKGSSTSVDSDNTHQDPDKLIESTTDEMILNDVIAADDNKDNARDDKYTMNNDVTDKETFYAYMSKMEAKISQLEQRLNNIDKNDTQDIDNNSNNNMSRPLGIEVHRNHEMGMLNDSTVSGDSYSDIYSVIYSDSVVKSEISKVTQFDAKFGTNMASDEQTSNRTSSRSGGVIDNINDDMKIDGGFAMADNHNVLTKKRNEKSSGKRRLNKTKTGEKSDSRSGNKLAERNNDNANNNNKQQRKTKSIAVLDDTQSNQHIEAHVSSLDTGDRMLKCNRDNHIHETGILFDFSTVDIKKITDSDRSAN